MKRYKDEFVPRARRRGYYRNIKLGKDLTLQRMDIGNQLRDMIARQLKLACSITPNDQIMRERINYLAFETRSIKDGFFGMKAAFEWEISDVVWQIEQNTIDFREMLKIIYEPLDNSLSMKRTLAQRAYEKGNLEDATALYLKLSRDCQNDFSVFLTLGIIYLFKKDDREEALDYFNKSIQISQPQSDYYTSYALLCKAFILCELNRIEEAEGCSRQAVNLAPDFAEAIYQNAQHNALLKKPDDVMPLIREVLHMDIIYYLKISHEPDFNGIKPVIKNIYKEISESQNNDFKNKMQIFDRKAHDISYVVNKIHESDYMISHDFNVELLQENRDELIRMADYNSILNIRVIDYCISQLSTFLHQDLNPLLVDCKKLETQLKRKKKDIAEKLLKAKKNNSLSRLSLYLFLSQFFAIPLCLALKLSYRILFYEGGVALAFFLVLFIIQLKPLFKLKKIHASLQKKIHDIDEMINIIGRTLFD